MKIKTHQILFIIIFIFSLFLRLYKLDQFPPSLNWDEISHTYNAYSLAKTGKDQWGVSWPIFNFRAYGDFPTTLNMYLTLPLVKYFGINAFTSRLPSALLGALTLIPTYFLAKLILKKEKLALFVTLLSAVSPWSLFPSRAVFQSTISSFFLIGGITLLLYTLKQQKKTLLIYSSVFLALSQYAYHNTRIVIPLLVPIILFIYKKQTSALFKKHKNTVLISMAIFLIFTIPQLINLSLPDSQARSRWTFILNQDAINIINHQRGQSTLSPFFARLVHNKLTYFIPKFITNYINFLNPYLLFFKGTGNYQFNIPNTGILYSICLPFFYIGILSLNKLSPNNKKLILLWFIIGLLPSALTSGDFPIIRAVSILPIPYILIALGLEFMPKLLPIISLGLFLQFFSYWNKYINFYPQKYSQSWQYGYKQAIDFIKENYSEYDQIYFTKKYGEAHEFVLFYWPWDPETYQSDPNKVWDYHANWYWVDAFDKFKFINDWEIVPRHPELVEGSSRTSTLLITSPNNYPQTNANHPQGDAKLLKTINFLDNTPAFEIIAYE